MTLWFPHYRIGKKYQENEIYVEDTFCLRLITARYEVKGEFFLAAWEDNASSAKCCLVVGMGRNSSNRGKFTENLFHGKFRLNPRCRDWPPVICNQYKKIEMNRVEKEQTTQKGILADGWGVMTARQDMERLVIQEQSPVLER